MKDSFKIKNQKADFCLVITFFIEDNDFHFRNQVFKDSKFKCAKFFFSSFNHHSILMTYFLCLDSVIRFTLFTLHLHLLKGEKKKKILSKIMIIMLQRKICLSHFQKFDIQNCTFLFHGGDQKRFSQLKIS